MKTTGGLGLGGRVTLALVLLAAPAAAQSRREMQMMADIRMLQEQTQQLQQQLASALATIGDSLKQLTSRVEDQAAVSRKAFADQKLVVDQLGSDLRVVRERVDETNVRLTALSQEVEALRLAIPSYPPTAAVPPDAAPVEPSAPTASPGAPGSTSGVPPPPLPSPAPVNPGISPQRLFDSAWSDYTSGQWALCVDGFGTYLKTFPRSDAADDAQFYIGECQSLDGKATEAMESYTRVIANYPKGDKVPDAYYKRGLAFENLGQLDRARESYETLMKAYPDSDSARLARQRLDRLLKGRPPR
jgi:tol-pal system protein YbgF